MQQSVEYDTDTDMLVLQLAARPSAESQEVGAGIVLDYDADGQVVGIEIEDASVLLRPFLRGAEVAVTSQSYLAALDALSKQADAGVDPAALEMVLLLAEMGQRERAVEAAERLFLDADPIAWRTLHSALVHLPPSYARLLREQLAELMRAGPERVRRFTLRMDSPLYAIYAVRARSTDKSLHKELIDALEEAVI